MSDADDITQRRFTMALRDGLRRGMSDMEAIDHALVTLGYVLVDGAVVSTPDYLADEGGP